MICCRKFFTGIRVDFSLITRRSKIKAKPCVQGSVGSERFSRCASGTWKKSAMSMARLIVRARLPRSYEPSTQALISPRESVSTLARVKPRPLRMRRMERPTPLESISMAAG